MAKKARFKKGSKAAKDYMAKIRAKRGKKTVRRKAKKKTVVRQNPKQRGYVIARLSDGSVFYYTGKEWSGQRSFAAIFAGPSIAKAAAQRWRIRWTYGIAPLAASSAEIKDVLSGKT